MLQVDGGTARVSLDKAALLPTSMADNLVGIVVFLRQMGELYTLRILRNACVREGGDDAELTLLWPLSGRMPKGHHPSFTTAYLTTPCMYSPPTYCGGGAPIRTCGTSK